MGRMWGGEVEIRKGAAVPCFHNAAIQLCSCYQSLQKSPEVSGSNSLGMQPMAQHPDKQLYITKNIDWIGLGSDSVKLSKKTVKKNVYFFMNGIVVCVLKFFIISCCLFCSSLFHFEGTIQPLNISYLKYVLKQAAFPVIIFSNTIHKKNDKGFFSTRYCTQTKTIPICDDAFTT